MTADDATVGRYRLVQRLGRGATGEVYEARDGDRTVALKLLYPHYAGDATNRSRFDRELEVVRGLEHPNIVRPLDTGWDERRETLFLVMELLEGETLAAHLAREPPPLRGALVAHVFEALDGLAAAHAAGVVHRDIKPENVFIDRKATPPRARLIDFGLAKHVAGDHLTLTEFALGTPTYMAPEQATRARDAGFAADVWSVGVLLYRIAAGFAPFEGEGPYDVLLKSTTQPAPPLVGVPAPMARLIAGCLEKDADLRPPSAAELKDRLREVVADPAVRAWLEAPSAPVRADKDATFPALEVPPSAGVRSSSAVTPGGASPGSRRRYGVLGMALGLGLAGAAAGAWLRGTGRPDRLELAPPPTSFASPHRALRLRPEPIASESDEGSGADRRASRRRRAARPAPGAVKAENEIESVASTPAPAPVDSEAPTSPPASASNGDAEPPVPTPAPAATTDRPASEPSAPPAPEPEPKEPPKEADEGTTEKKVRPEELLTF